VKHILNSFIFFAVAVFSATAQQATFQDSLLDHFTGKWVLQGTISGKGTTHDIIAAWVLGHQYVQFQEVSREKDAKGEAMYEAIVYIGWDQPSSQYSCLWLDNTGGGGLSAHAIAYAKQNSDTIAFIFKESYGSIFHTTFLYDRGSDTWQWLMDGEENGKLQPFARVSLTRK
jgi:hypothetical protein